MSEWTDQDIENYYKIHPELRPKTGQLYDYDSHMAIDANTPQPSKYRAQRTNGYSSKKEAAYVEQLAIRQKAGEIWFWLEQVPFKLPGGAKHRVDFMVFYHRDYYGRYGNPWELVEVKGKDLPMGKLKRRQTEQLYNVKIKVV